MHPKIYIAGPVTGRPNLNLPAFLSAAARLEIRGYNPIVPHKLLEGLDFDPVSDYKEIMKLCLGELLSCQGLAQLPDWRYSPGARIEVQVATYIGLKVQLIGDWRNLNGVRP
jgi:hypothetical protein